LNDALYFILVFSASSDTTIKIWNAQKFSLIDSLKSHNDYVKCLAYAKDKEVLISGGFDKNIFIWDLTTLSVHPNTSSLRCNYFYYYFISL
jgi:WD repeat-containing protein 48